MRGKRKANDRMGHQNWLVINKKKNNVGKWQNRQLQSFRRLFSISFSRFTTFFLYLVSTFATFADCVNMSTIGTCSLQSVLVRWAVMKVNRPNDWRKVAFKSFLFEGNLEEIEKSSKVFGVSRVEAQLKLIEPAFKVWSWFFFRVARKCQSNACNSRELKCQSWTSSCQNVLRQRN